MKRNLNKYFDFAELLISEGKNETVNFVATGTRSEGGYTYSEVKFIYELQVMLCELRSEYLCTN